MSLHQKIDNLKCDRNSLEYTYSNELAQMQGAISDLSQRLAAQEEQNRDLQSRVMQEAHKAKEAQSQTQCLQSELKLSKDRRVQLRALLEEEKAKYK